MTVQTVTDLETKKVKMLPIQYIAVAALTDNYFMNYADKLKKFKEIIDSDGKNYDVQYETSFEDDSLLKCWFQDFIFTQDNEEDLAQEEKFFPTQENHLLETVQDYKVFLTQKTLLADDAEKFVENLTVALNGTAENIIIPLRSIEELKTEVTPEEYDKVLSFIEKMQNCGVAKIFGEETDSDFYLTIFKVFERLREKYQLCLITPNEYLAYRILILRERKFDDINTYRPFIVEPAFIHDGKIRFYDDEIIFEKFEGREKTVHLDIKNIPTNCWGIDSDTEDNNATENKKIITWQEL